MKRLICLFILAVTLTSARAEVNTHHSFYLVKEICSDKDNRQQAIQFLNDYPASPYRHIILCVIADSYLRDGMTADALEYYDRINLDGLDDYAAEDAALHTGYALSESDRWNRAENMFRRLLGTRHDNEANFYLGYIMYQRGQLHDANIYFSKVRPSNDEPLKYTDVYLAQIQYLQKDYAKSLRTARKAVKDLGIDDKQPGLNSFEAEAARILGESAYNTGDKSTALKYVRIYANSSNELKNTSSYILGEEAYTDGNYDEAIRLLTPVTNEDNVMGQSAQFLIGMSYMHSMKYSSALLALNNAYMMTFDYNIRETALYNYAVAKMMGGKTPFGSSASTFERFLKEFPESRFAPEVQEYIITGYLTDNNYEAALASINALSAPTEETLKTKQLILYTLGCRAIGSENADATTIRYAVGHLREAKSMEKYNRDIARECDLWIGEALYKQGNYDQAIDCYKTYIKTAPKTATNGAVAYYDLGYAQFGKKDFESAYNSFNTFRNKTEVDATIKADAINRMADCLYYRSRFDEAAKLYDEAYDTAPSSGDYALYQQSIMKGLRREHSLKIEGLKEMMKRFPNSGLYPSALLEMAEAYQELGNRDMVISTYNTLVSKFPDTAQGRQGLLLLAITHLNDGNRDKAIATYRRVVSDYPTSEEARVATEDLKRIYTEDSNVEEFIAFIRSVKNAPQIDNTEIESLTFAGAENRYLKHNDTSLLENYISEYPHGIYTAQALNYTIQASKAAGDTDAVMKAAKRIITDFPHSVVVEDAYLALAEAQVDEGMLQDALATYRGLEARASSAAVQNNARMGIMRTARELGDYSLLADVTEKLLSSSTIGANNREEISFSRGTALLKLGDTDNAESILTELATNLNSIYGTKAAFYLAQYSFDNGDMSAARKYSEMIIDANIPHDYWLARAFILLSDVCRQEGNTFEADEYLKSLRNNYPGTEPDIFAMIDERLNN